MDRLRLSEPKPQRKASVWDALEPEAFPDSKHPTLSDHSRHVRWWKPAVLRYLLIMSAFPAALKSPVDLGIERRMAKRAMVLCSSRFLSTTPIVGRGWV